MKKYSGRTRSDLNLDQIISDINNTRNFEIVDQLMSKNELSAADYARILLETEDPKWCCYSDAQFARKSLLL